MVLTCKIIGFLNVDRHAPDAASPGAIDVDIAGQPEHPILQIRANLPLVNAAQGTFECCLQQVVALIGIPGQAVTKAAQTWQERDQTGVNLFVARSSFSSGHHAPQATTDGGGDYSGACYFFTASRWEL
jgi:hypothetical protein